MAHPAGAVPTRDIFFATGRPAFEGARMTPYSGLSQSSAAKTLTDPCAKSLMKGAFLGLFLLPKFSPEAGEYFPKRLTRFTFR